MGGTTGATAGAATGMGRVTMYPAVAVEWHPHASLLPTAERAACPVDPPYPLPCMWVGVGVGRMAVRMVGEVLAHPLRRRRAMAGWPVGVKLKLKLKLTLTLTRTTIMVGCRHPPRPPSRPWRGWTLTSETWLCPQGRPRVCVGFRTQSALSTHAGDRRASSTCSAWAMQQAPLATFPAFTCAIVCFGHVQSADPECADEGVSGW